MAAPLHINTHIYSCSHSIYEQIYYVLLSQDFLLFWKQQSIIQMVLNKIIRKEAGHKGGRFNNCPLDLCLQLCLDLERLCIDAFYVIKDSL